MINLLSLLQKISLGVLSILTLGCVDEFDITLENSTPRLVVDGRITNQPGPHLVKLTRSISDSIYIDDRVTGASIFISDDEGNREQLIEIAPGEYWTDPMGIQGITGRTYIVEVTLTNGDVFSSEPETLPESVPIENVYFEWVVKENISSEGISIDVPGMEIYVDTENLNLPGNYYMWEYEGTYEIRTPYTDTIRCWLSDNPVEYLNISQTHDIVGNRVQRQPIEFITEGSKLEFEYSMLVMQLILSQRAYKFWDDVKKFKNNIGSIFDPTPFRIVGNIINNTNPENYALGFFSAVAVTEERIFIQCIDLEGRVSSILDFCQNDASLVDLSICGRNELLENPDMNAPPYCLDCSLLLNSTTVKPDFWP